MTARKRSDELISQVRDLRCKGISIRATADKLGISRAHVCRICSNTYSGRVKPKGVRTRVINKNWRSPKRKLTDAQVLEILHFDYNSITMTDIASRYGVNRDTIRNIRDGKVYKDVIAKKTVVSLYNLFSFGIMR